MTRERKKDTANCWPSTERAAWAAAASSRPELQDGFEDTPETSEVFQSTISSSSSSATSSKWTGSATGAERGRRRRRRRARASSAARSSCAPASCRCHLAGRRCNAPCRRRRAGSGRTARRGARAHVGVGVCVGRHAAASPPWLPHRTRQRPVVEVVERHSAVAIEVEQRGNGCSAASAAARRARVVAVPKSRMGARRAKRLGRRR